MKIKDFKRNYSRNSKNSSNKPMVKMNLTQFRETADKPQYIPVHTRRKILKKRRNLKPINSSLDSSLPLNISDVNQYMVLRRNSRNRKLIRAYNSSIDSADIEKKITAVLIF